MKNKKVLFFLPAIFILVIIFVSNPPAKKEVKNASSSNVVSVAPVKNEFSYKGEDGVDALTILKQKTEVSQDKTGMVVSINKRPADSSKREFWGFYVNGKMAEIGPADYKTKNGDVIEWKIEKY